jgi:hypothetical protein
MIGLIGFFDILGYQSFLKNNSASESALKVLEIINEVPRNAKENTGKIANSKPELEEIVKSLSHLVFSDTIVFTLTYPKKADDNWIQSAKSYFSVCSGVLVAEMFKNGLPVRGVIHEGDFVTKESCLAGQGIVEAYQLCSELNLSGLVFTKEFGEKVIKRNKVGTITDESRYLFPYLTPMNNGSEAKLLNLNWLTFIDIDDFEKDPEKYVLKSFLAHQKDCPASVDIKVKNTIKNMLRMLLNNELDEKKKVEA